MVLVVGVVLYARRDHAQTNERPILRVNTVYSLKEIAIALRTWEGDHGDDYPWNVSTNAGGSKEFCAPGSNGFDANSFRHFQVMSNELETTKLLVCPDSGNQPAADFASLQSSNVSFRIRVVPGITPAHAKGNKTPMIVCPIDGSVLYYDGSVKAGKPDTNAPNSMVPGL
jgi:hypothetical protein